MANIDSQWQQQVIKNYINAYNNFDIDGMLKDLHADIHFENSAGGEVNLTTNGIDAFRKQAENAKAIFAKREQRIVGIKSSGAQVEVKIDYTGTLNCDLPNGLKAGDTINLNGRSTFTFKDDKIITLKDES